MLSDAIREMRRRFEDGVSAADPAGLVLTLRAFEMEARNMEDRLEYLTGQPHAVLDGRLLVAREAPHV
ncbi:MAG: hypothetical protein K0M55_07070 [Rhizobium sp.]|nr:hypothetical protein [Rhizobium sp.]